MSRIFLIRHGSTALNSEGSGDKIRGHLNLPLAPNGKTEAIRAGNDLKGYNVETLFCSDLLRAEQTAAIVSEKNGGIAIVPRFGLRPWHLGPMFEGKDSAKMHPELMRFVRTPDKSPPDGESFNTFKNRFLKTICGIIHDYQDHNIGLVVHYRCFKLIQALQPKGELNIREFGLRSDIPPGSVEPLTPSEVDALRSHCRDEA